MVRVLALLLLVLLAVPAAAGATAATSTAITSPADLTRAFNDRDVPDDQLTVSGTSNGSAPDTVTIRCTRLLAGGGRLTRTFATSVPLAADGTFSVQLPNSIISFGPCRLAATPGATLPADLTPFAGPRVILGESAPRRIATGPNAGALQDVDTVLPTDEVIAEFNGVGYCGVCYLILTDIGSTTTDPVQGLGLWATGPMFLGVEPSGTRTYAQVDGRRTFFAGNTVSGNDGTTLPSFPGLTWAVTRDPAGGGTIVDTESPVRCQDGATTVASCTSFASLGVELTRTMRTLAGGHVVDVRDVWRSTDGQAHSLDLDSYFETINNGVTWANGPDPAASFSARTAGSALPAPSAPGAPVTLLVKTVNADDAGSLGAPRGSVTFGAGYTGGVFLDNGRLSANALLTVPAGGSVQTRTVLSIDRSATLVAGRAALAEDLVTPPSITLVPVATSVPAATTTVDVSGQATDARSVATVRVNGVAATVATDGSYTATVPVAVGSNTLTAVVTDGAGNTASATATVTRAAPPAPPEPPAGGGGSTTPQTTPAPGTGTGTTPAPDTVAPVITKLAAKRAKVSFTSSEAGSAKVTVLRRTIGRRVGSRCVRATTANRSAKRCTRLTPVRTLARPVVAGANTIRFRALAAGAYVVRLVVTDAAGNAARPSRALTVRRPRR